MTKTVLENIVHEIKISKYFSIIVNSTPDILKVDQLTVAIRYILPDSLPVEHFLGFLSSVGHKAKYMELAILQIFSDLEIDIKSCRG
jgi:hypothetical protein